MHEAGFDILIWIAGGALAFKILELLFVSPEERRWRRIVQLPLSPLAELREGTTVKVRGKVLEVDQPLVAPISGRACVYYEVTVRHLVAGSWDLLTHERRSVDEIWLEDGTERALVDLGFAQLLRRAVAEELLVDGRLHSDDRRVRGFLDSRGLSAGEVATYSELILPVGVEVGLVGKATREPDPAPRQPVGYRRIALRLHFRGSRREPLFLLLGELAEGKRR